MGNNDIIQKADMTLADLTTNGGVLLPEQADAFIRKMLIQPTILGQTRSVTMNSPQRKINKIGFGSRIMRKATSATALDAADRSAPTTSQIELNTKEVIAEVRLPYDVIEDNIERGRINAAGPNSAAQPVQGGLKDTIISMIAERAALDLEELALLGDTTLAGTDAYLGLLDGYLKKSTSNIVDLAGQPISRTMFKNGVIAMPDQYLRNRAAMKHFVSVDNETEYRDVMAVRETTLGDAMATGNNPVYAFGSQVEAAPLMPAASGLFTIPNNLIFGIQRQISVEVDKDISARVFIIVLTARVDFQIEEEEAVVRYSNIG